MPDDVPVDVVVAAFSDEDGASKALNELKEAHKEGIFNIREAAVLTRNESNQLHIVETADKGYGRGALIGGVGGAVVGVLAGPIGLATIGGAAIGALAAKLRDGGFKDERLKKIGESLKPGTSALVAVVEHEWVKQLEERIREMAADVVTETISADIASQLEDEAQKTQTTSEGTPSTSEGQTKAA